MIKILTTSYLDQSQAIGLNTILEYYGLTAIIEGCLNVTLESKQPSIAFNSQHPEIEFNSKRPSIVFSGRCSNDT